MAPKIIIPPDINHKDLQSSFEALYSQSTPITHMKQALLKGFIKWFWMHLDMNDLET